MSILINFRKALSSFLDGVVADIKRFASAFLPKLGDRAEAAIEEIAEVALQAVVEQAQKTIKGEVKFNNAVDTVLKAVTASGKTIAVQTAQAAVQIAYLEAVRIAKESK